MEEECTNESLEICSTVDRCTANQNGRTCIQPHLFMSSISLESTDTVRLHKYNLSPAGQYGRNHDSNNTCSIDINTGSICNRLALTDSTEFLAETSAHNSGIEQAQGKNQ